jgi:hypothetical protein
MILNNEDTSIPARIIERMHVIKIEVESLIKSSTTHQRTTLDKIQFQFHQSASKPLLSEFERALSVCFVAKYESLPKLDGVMVTEENGQYHFENLHQMRHIINEFRTIISNQSDSIYYQKIHKFIRGLLTNNDPSKDLVVDVLDENGKNVTDIFIKILDERIKSSRTIIENSDYKYIYNGILQHSDHEYTDRFWDEYMSGEINYVFLKHALILNPISDLLKWHYRIINSLTFPKLGNL